MVPTTGRAVVLVLDSAGVGGAPDAAAYGDEGSATLPHVAEVAGPLRLPHLERLGLGRIVPLRGVAPVPHPAAAFGRLQERSAGKDSTTGHWELMGVILERPFPTYPDGFPAEVIRAVEAAIGRPVLGNRPASGTAIIEELGAEHLRTGAPIVYTSADSVFQIAAHEDIVPVETLYRWCEVARGILQGPHTVSRVIARPFVGTPGAFRRTDRRRDFSLAPVAPTVLDALAARGVPVWAVGKVWDLFAGRGITRHVPTHDDLDGLARLAEALRSLEAGCCVANVVDLDTLYGHRNDPEGYARQLERIDAALGPVLAALRPGDLFILTADHGNDPTTPSTDHSRELVPVLAVGPGLPAGTDLGVRRTFADVAATVARHLGVPWDGPGEPFSEEGRR
ncbi:MAG: phosphopentomutase [Armatimonadota bacterium]|nr:phosphopentomutase [Armatimonadota bacterium]MDR7447649.1 phosphopentomutase [Armatimonadota bacterium]MDR7458984.1 phosphopentomutase [Armatimonadota bacterium]MDR7480086.1 phosphopentomutase [Armatimonadota bacterium]MDR7488783.1 phosphopentomutase [Armatimonadota bacterium]